MDIEMDMVVAIFLAVAYELYVDGFLDFWEQDVKTPNNFI